MEPLVAYIRTNSGLCIPRHRRMETDDGPSVRFGCVLCRGPIVETFFRRLEGCPPKWELGMSMYAFWSPVRIYP
jgi:hypothetical protein